MTDADISKLSAVVVQGLRSVFERELLRRLKEINVDPDPMSRPVTRRQLHQFLSARAGLQGGNGNDDVNFL